MKPLSERHQRKFVRLWNTDPANKGNHLSRHHRNPKSKKGTGDSSNISIVPVADHNHWHAMFENKHPKEIVKLINTVWLDPRFEFICVERRI